MEASDTGGGISVMFWANSEEARMDPAFLEAAGIGYAGGGGGDKVVGDIAGEGEGYADSHKDEIVEVEEED